MEIFMYQKALSFFTKLYNNRDEAKYFGSRPMKPKLPTRSPIKYPFQRTTPEATGIRSEHIYAFVKELSEMTELAPHLLMITKDDKVICETEFYPYRMDTWHVSHSLCKSITAIAVGLLVEDGLISLDEKITDIFSKDSLIHILLEWKRTMKLQKESFRPERTEEEKRGISISEGKTER